MKEKKVDDSMGDKLAKLYYDSESKLSDGSNGKNYVHVPNLEILGNVAISSIKAIWTPYIMKLIEPTVLAWTDRSKATAEIIIVKNT